MTATARLKQLLFIAAALALVGLGLVAAVSTASPARATETQPCVETPDGYTQWTQTGTIVQHGDATPPGTNTDLKEYRGPTESKDVTQEAQEGTPAQDTRVWWVFRGQNGDAAPAPGSTLWKAQPNLPAVQSQHSYPGENGLGNPYQPGANAGNGDWFRFTGELIPAVEGTPEVSHTDYTWTVWEREFVPGNECPPPPMECPNGDYNGTDPGCGTPPEECPNGDFNGQEPGCGTPPVEKKVVVCKYVGTPPGGLDHIVIVSENTLNNLVDGNGDPFTGDFPFSWTDAQGQTTEGSVAIRYAADGEQAKDVLLTECPNETPPVECPDGDFNGADPGCGTPPEECPNGDFNGQEPGCGTPPEECPNGDFNGADPGCGTPPVEKKVVVCKYVGTPPGGLDHIVIVSENTLNNLLDGNGDPFTGVFPFSWTDAQGQTTEGSVAIRYAADGEQAKDVLLTECPNETPPVECPDGDFNGEEPGCGEPPVECPNGDFNGDQEGCGEPPVECPNGDFNGDQEGCGEPPVECPNGDFNGDQEGCGEPPVECPNGDFNGQEPGCGEPNPGPETCPEGTDKAGEAIPDGKDPVKFCDDDDEVCPEGTDHAGEEVKHGQDPAKVCDDDDNMPPNNPGEPNGPSNHPNPGPTVKGAQASVPNASTSTPTVAVAPPAAKVPTAVDAGLAPSQRDSSGNGGNLGLLGIATALVGAGLVSASLRPRRGRSLTG